MEKKRMMTAAERHDHYLPLAQAILEGIACSKEWAEESGWDKGIAHYLDKMEWHAHYYAGDMECGEIKDREDMLADIFDEYLYAAKYVNEKTEVTPMIIWEYDDDLLLVGIPKYTDCTRCLLRYKCEKDERCSEEYGKIIILTAEDTEPGEWEMHEEDWKIAEAVGVFRKVPEHWELMYKEALDK